MTAYNFQVCIFTLYIGLLGGDLSSGIFVQLYIYQSTYRLYNHIRLSISL